jgi:hypothetical protein
VDWEQLGLVAGAHPVLDESDSLAMVLSRLRLLKRVKSNALDDSDAAGVEVVTNVIAWVIGEGGRLE